METISNVTSGVSKMVFGENTQNNETGGEEPVSGKTGKGTADEPYDQGNRSAGPTSPTSPTSPDDNKDTSGATNTEGPSGPSAPHPTNEGIQDPASGQKPEQKQQGGDRPTEDPSETTGTDAAVKASKEEAEQAQKALEHKDPNDHSGEPLKMHEGNEKNEESAETEGDGKHPGQAGGPASKGTGTEHVKTTGFASEGGDFDATKPGAGAEADRLLEQKGVKKSTDKDEGSPAPSSQQGGTDSASSTPAKRSMSKRIKDKLHLGKKE